MISRARWGGALLLLVAIAAQGCELPPGQPDQVPVTLRLDKAGPLVIHENDTLEIEALDPQGRRIADPTVSWAFGGPAAPVNVLEEGGPAAVVVALNPGDLYVEAKVTDPRFAAPKLRDTVKVGYGPLTLSVVGLASDTVLTRTARGSFYLRPIAVDRYGDTARSGEFTAATRDRSVAFTGAGIASEAGTDHWELSFYAGGFGPDTITIWYSLCPNPCVDTLTVDVAPVPWKIWFADNRPFYWANTLNVPIQIPAVALDNQFYPIPYIPLVFQLADTSGILSLVDSLTGVFLTRSNGPTAVQVSGGGISDSVSVRVQQQIDRIEPEMPSYVVGVGTTFPGTFRAWDPGGNPVDLESLRNEVWYYSGCGANDACVWPNWSTTDSSVAVVAYAPGNIDAPAQLRTQGYGATDVDLTVQQCMTPNCWYVSARDSLRVIPEPDSVRAYSQDGSTTLNGIGSTANWLGDIYLSDSTITAVSLVWTSLDSAVATIDLNGLVTAVSPGTARIVGSMGAAADTSVVTVVGSGP